MFCSGPLERTVRVFGSCRLQGIEDATRVEWVVVANGGFRLRYFSLLLVKSELEAYKYREHAYLCL